MADRKREPAAVVHLENLARSLLLEPLADVAFMKPNRRGQLVRQGTAEVVESAVEAEAYAEVDGKDVPRAEGRPEQALDESVSPFSRLGRRHPRYSAVSIWAFWSFSE